MKQHLAAAIALAALSVSLPQATEVAGHQSPGDLAKGRPNLEIKRDGNPESSSGSTGGHNVTLAQGINCRVVEALGTSLRPRILAELDSEVAGTSYRIGSVN